MLSLDIFHLKGTIRQHKCYPNNIIPDSKRQLTFTIRS